MNGREMAIEGGSPLMASDKNQKKDQATPLNEIPNSLGEIEMRISDGHLSGPINESPLPSVSYTEYENLPLFSVECDLANPILKHNRKGLETHSRMRGRGGQTTGCSMGGISVAFAGRN